MKVLLLAGYRKTNEEELPVGLSLTDSGKILLSDQLQFWKHSGFEVVVVLAGEQADDQLRSCRELAHFEMAFDTTREPSVFTNLRAGLGTTEEAALVFPVEFPNRSKAVCQFLKNEFFKVGFRTQYSFLQVESEERAAWQVHFPLLVTREGNKLIRRNSDLQGFQDPRLTYLRIAYPGALPLAYSDESL